MQAQQSHQTPFFGKPVPPPRPNNHASHLVASSRHTNDQLSPQDATYSSNVVNPPQSPQYFHSSHGYYVPPGQEKHPNVWQRPNSRQMQQKKNKRRWEVWYTI